MSTYLFAGLFWNLLPRIAGLCPFRYLMTLSLPNESFFGSFLTSCERSIIFLLESVNMSTALHRSVLDVNLPILFLSTAYNDRGCVI
jgi:hypothetical protein